jgi:hypothetical protein
MIKNERIENVSMCISVALDFSLLNDNLKLTAVYQCFLYKHENKLTVDIDFTDVENITFMNIPVKSGFAEFNIWKENMAGIGLNIEDLLDKQCYNSIIKNRISERLIKAKYGNNNLDK